MWTPRRIGLVLLGLTGAVAAFLGYSIAFGTIDGLPELPEKFFLPASGQQAPANYSISRTERNLAEAFGPNSLEVTDNSTYKTKVEMQERGMVIASGSPNPNGTIYVTMSPISVIQFGKSTPGTKPGETREISTFHADRARLRFDRPVNNLQELNDKAKLVEIELISDPDLDTNDTRRGHIEITNNQRSSDFGDLLVIKTVGPLFYRVPDETVPYNPEVAHVWTAAAVEVTDRRNLPRTLRGGVPTVALGRADDLRRQSSIADILLGAALPPPTITAEGMKIYLQPDEPKGTPAKGKSSTGGNSVREILLQEKVQMNLWNDGGAGLPGGNEAPVVVPVKSVADSGIGMPALLGSVWDGAGTVEKLLGKSLLVMETPGAFRYDFEKSTARFDIAPQAPPGGQPNMVTVTRLSATKGQDNLFCNVLVLDFSDPPGVVSTRPKNGGPRDNGFVMRTLTATGPQVFLSVESDGLTAQGTELRYDRDAKKGRSITTLRGSPAYAKRDGSQLWGGDAVNFADIVIDSVDAAPAKDGKPSPGKSTILTVNGPGRLEFFDTEQKALTGTASWGKSLRHEKIAGQRLELLKFEGPGRFADTDGDLRLTGDKLWLWLAANEKPAAARTDGKPSGGTNSKPEKLIADGNVEGGSPEMIIQKTDKLFVNFRDTDPPKLAAVAPAPVGPQPPLIGPKPVVDPNAPKLPAPVEPEKEAPNPTYLSAAVIHANVIRYPVKALPKDPRLPAPATPPTTLKYELETALCEERVIAYQNPDPKDPAKPAIGLLIKCIKLNLEQSSAGSVMVCTGTDDLLAEVHFETSSLYGPVVEIDQPNNSAKVNGRGKLRMLSGADLNGNDLAKPSDLVIDFAKEMRFYGARSRAEFLQTVVATQTVMPDPPAKDLPDPRTAAKPSEQLPNPKDLGELNPYTTRSTLMGHRLDITFDRPIYFNQMKKAKREPVRDPKTGLAIAEERAKLKTAVTTPVPEDERAAYPGGKPSRDVYFLEEVFDGANKYVRARRLRAKQIDFTNREKEQELYAAGEGQLRILQFEKDEEETPAAPVSVNPNVRVAKKPEPGEMKLTVVDFNRQMVAKDRGKVYQDAVFDKGATAYSIPTDDLNLRFEKHALPKKSTVLTCVDSLTVSTSQTKKDAKPVQWMVANGNAEFRNDTYLGIGGRVTYNGQQFVFDGTPNRLATLSKLTVGLGQSEYHQAEQLIYKKDGSIKANKSSGGTFIPGG